MPLSMTAEAVGRVHAVHDDVVGLMTIEASTDQVSEDRAASGMWLARCSSPLLAMNHHLPLPLLTALGQWRE
jgi:hypothetical protein